MSGLGDDCSLFEESIESSGLTGKCRICWRTSYLRDLLSPCNCSGSQQYTHFECLKRWIQERDSTERDVCDVCRQKYNEIVVKQNQKSFCQWLREEEDTSAKIISSIILMLFFFYLLNMGCIQFITTEDKINAIIRYIQMVLILFFALLFSIVSIVALFVFRSEFKEWQSTNMNTVVERTDSSGDRRSSDSSWTTTQSKQSTESLDGSAGNDNQSRNLIVNDSQQHYGSV